MTLKRLWIYMCATTLSFLPQILLADSIDTVEESRLPVAKGYEHIADSLRSHTMSANLKDNPESLAASSKMELAHSELLRRSGDLGLSEKDVEILVETNRTTESGARQYSEVVQRRAKNEIQVMCDFANSTDLQLAENVATAVKKMDEIEDIEEHDAQLYWEDVISRLSDYGQQSYAAILNSIGSIEGTGMSQAKVDWTGFGAERPEFMAQ